jgi:Protein of unknown function (DUF732)
MRDREAIDSELRKLAAQRRSIRERGGQPSSHQVDKLLDERLGHRPEVSETTVVTATWPPYDDAVDITPRRRKRRPRRLGLLAALPLSLVAIAAALVMMFAVHNRHPTAEPADVPPSGEPPNPAAPQQQPPAPPANHTPPLRIVDKALVETLQHEGVPVPSQEYVTAQGHAVCDFLGQQPSFAEAVSFVQRNSIWDANQSADVAAGAIVSYCPQYEAATSDQMQQTFQNSLSTLQAIQGDLQGINGDLQGIRDGLHPGS